MDKITDDLIYFITRHYSPYSKDITGIKEKLKQKGYEVEEKKSKLDEAQWYKNEFLGHENVTRDFTWKAIMAYEEAIKEIQEQQKTKIDDDLIDWLQNVRVGDDDFITSYDYSTAEDKQFTIKLFRILGIE
jgi:uncharacterized protein YwgA